MLSLIKLRALLECMQKVRYMKSSAYESKPFQSRSTVEITGRARHEERLSRSKLKLGVPN